MSDRRGSSLGLDEDGLIRHESQRAMTGPVTVDPVVAARTTR
jgi:hypothetical protein